MYTVLICDDSMFMRKVIKNTFYKMNLNIEVIGEASNGVEAIEQYKKLKPNFVTMDITMEKKNGLEALKGIMEFDSNANVIMVSSMGQKILVLEAISAGAKDFIIKPFNENLIKNTFSKQIANIERKDF